MRVTSKPQIAPTARARLPRPGPAHRPRRAPASREIGRRARPRSARGPTPTARSSCQIRVGGQERVVADAGDAADCDLVLALGGDGTTLHALHAAAEAGRPVLGVACGSLGALTATAAEDSATRSTASRRASGRRGACPRCGSSTATATDARRDQRRRRRAQGRRAGRRRDPRRRRALRALRGRRDRRRDARSGRARTRWPRAARSWRGAATGSSSRPIANHGGCCPPLVVGSDSEVYLDIEAGYGGARLELDGQIDDAQPAELRAARVEDYATLVAPRRRRAAARRPAPPADPHRQPARARPRRPRRGWARAERRGRGAACPFREAARGRAGERRTVEAWQRERCKSAGWTSTAPRTSATSAGSRSTAAAGPPRGRHAPRGQPPGPDRPRRRTPRRRPRRAGRDRPAHRRRGRARGPGAARRRRPRRRPPPLAATPSPATGPTSRVEGVLPWKQDPLDGPRRGDARRPRVPRATCATGPTRSSPRCATSPTATARRSCTARPARTAPASSAPSRLAAVGVPHARRSSPTTSRPASASGRCSPGCAPRRRTPRTSRDRPDESHRPRAETMRRFLAVLDERHGGAPGWLDAHGFGADGRRRPARAPRRLTPAARRSALGGRDVADRGRERRDLARAPSACAGARSTADRGRARRPAGAPSPAGPDAGTNPPPQFGHTFCSSVATQSAQNVHS